MTKQMFLKDSQLCENQIFLIKTVQKETYQSSYFEHLSPLQTEQATFKLNQWNIYKNPGC